MDAPKQRPEMNLRQMIMVAVVDVLMLAELCLALYLASTRPDDFTPTFMKSFFLMTPPTLVAGFVCVRLMRSKPEARPS